MAGGGVPGKTAATRNADGEEGRVSCLFSVRGRPGRG